MSKTDDELLNEALDGGGNSTLQGIWNNRPGQTQEAAPPTSSSSQVNTEYRQWQAGSNDTFRPAGITCERLAPAVYQFDEDHYGLFVRKIAVITDSLTPLPDTTNERVLNGMEIFWKRQEKYKEHGLLYKRGVLLWGPPGSGKTATIQLLSKNLIAMGGIVVFCSHPRLTSMGLAALRRIEPERRLICVFEDIDEIISVHGEHQVLALLDGENQVENIVNIATTNYPELLGARIVNRPSRFDERILVAMPSFAARGVYLRKVCVGLTGSEVRKWVVDTEGLSIAHLRELAASVLCLGQEYESVLYRLKTMKQKMRDNDGLGMMVGFVPGLPVPN